MTIELPPTVTCIRLGALTRCLLGCSRSVLFGARRCFVVSPVSRSLARCRTDGSPDGSGPGALYFLYIAITRWRHSGHQIDSPLTPPQWQSCLLLHGRTNTSRLRRDQARRRAPSRARGQRASGGEGRNQRPPPSAGGRAGDRLGEGWPPAQWLAGDYIHAQVSRRAKGRGEGGRAIYSKEQGEEEKRADGVAGDGRKNLLPQRVVCCTCVHVCQTNSDYLAQTSAAVARRPVRIFSRSARQDFGRTAVTSRRFAGGNVGVV